MPTGEPVNLKEKVRHLSDKPGVYLMKDRLGRIIYVGKAKNLKKRVSTYFTPSRAMTWHPKIRALIEMIAAVAHGLNGNDARARAWAESARARAGHLRKTDFLRAFPFRDLPTRNRVTGMLGRLGF